MTKNLILPKIFVNWERLINFKHQNSQNSQTIALNCIKNNKLSSDLIKWYLFNNVWWLVYVFINVENLFAFKLIRRYLTRGKQSSPWLTSLYFLEALNTLCSRPILGFHKHFGNTGNVSETLTWYTILPSLTNLSLFLQSIKASAIPLIPQLDWQQSTSSLGRKSVSTYHS